jgi:hypothetical protein
MPRAGSERGVNLCLWAGADPHTPAPHPGSGLSGEADTEDGEEPFIGWTAMEEAARQGNLAILKRLGPDPARDDFDDLYRAARYEFIVAFLATDPATEGSHRDPLVALHVVGGSLPLGEPHGNWRD